MVLCLQMVTTVLCFIKTKLFKLKSNIPWPHSLCHLSAITFKYPEPTFLLHNLILSSREASIYLVIFVMLKFTLLPTCFASVALLNFNIVDYNEGTNYNPIKYLNCSYYGITYFQFSWLSEGTKPPRPTVLGLSEPVSM
jgi:hypothetical protein